MTPMPTQKLSLIGRANELMIIDQAIRSLDLAIVYVEGTAGIGKTMLLEEAEKNALRVGALCPPIIDFYDTEMHSNQGLEDKIAHGLDAEEIYFSRYRDLRKRDPEGDLWDEFLEAYAQLAANARIVLRFDTAERLEYEREPEAVRADFELGDMEAPSWRWLLEKIDALPNTAVLIASRPTSLNLLRDRLHAKHPQSFKAVNVETFEFDETKAYFLETKVGREIAREASDILVRVHDLTQGRPILISLALEWLQRGMWDRDTLQQIDSRDFEELLVSEIRNLSTPLDKAVLLAALCRKGCNSAILSKLMHITSQEASNLVNQLRTLSFVKLPRSEGHHEFFLHDEMYDLVERFIWSADWPDHSKQKQQDALVIGWYEDQIADLQKQIRECQDWRKSRPLRRRQQLLYSERLYYQLDQDPSAGYRVYISLAEQAIGARELEWDHWLRNELLGFVAHRPLRWKQLETYRISEIEHDARRLWVNRYVAREWNEKAISIAQNLLRQEKQPGEPSLYRIGLQVALATAQTYKGGALVNDAIKNFDEAIKSIEIMFGSQIDRWLPRYLLGIAYLYKGLAVRAARPLVEAQQAYGKAIYRFRNLQYQHGLAEALNNLAFIMAQQGKLKQALAASEEALAIREELGDGYSIALSLNTKGIIFERLDRPVSAIHQSKQALEIFTEIGKERGIILAKINLGRSYRRRGRSREWGPQETDFVDGSEHLLNAIQRQEEQGPNAEEYYRIQAQNELGCLYRDWVAMLYDRQPDDQRISSLLEDAENHLRKAIDLASATKNSDSEYSLQYIDSLEDLARVYYWRARIEHGGESNEKQEQLQRMKELLDKAENLASVRAERWDELKLIRGKIYFQKARHAQEAEDTLETARNFALAASYAESYSPDAQELTKMAYEASYWLVSHGPDEARVYIDTMRDALKGRPGSKRLEEWIGSVVEARLGVGWENEVTYG